VWRARWTIPALSAAVIRVDAAFGAEAPMRGTVERAAGPVSTVHLEFDRDVARVDDPEPVGITVRVLDAAGYPTDADVRLEADRGQLEPVERIDRGKYRSSLLLRPGSLRASGDVTVVASAVGVLAHGTIRIGPGPAMTVKIDVPDSMHADGVSVASLTVDVADRFGNPSDEPLSGVDARYGEVSPASQIGPGRWAIKYRPRRLSQDAREDIRVRAGTRTSANRAVRLLAPASALTISPIVGLAFRTGPVRPVFGVEVAGWRHVGLAELGLALQGAWWGGETSEAYGVERRLAPLPGRLWRAHRAAAARLQRGARLLTSAAIRSCMASVRTSLRSTLGSEQLTISAPSPARDAAAQRLAGSDLERSAASRSAKARGRSSRLPQTTAT
jgi:hypothetical protein